MCRERLDISKYTETQKLKQLNADFGVGLGWVYSGKNSYYSKIWILIEGNDFFPQNSEMAGQDFLGFRAIKKTEWLIFRKPASYLQPQPNQSTPSHGALSTPSTVGRTQLQT